MSELMDPQTLLGPFVAATLSLLLLRHKASQVQKDVFKWDQRKSYLKHEISLLKDQHEAQSQQVQIQEEAVQALSQMYGLSKEFLATLDLEEGLRITGEVLRREFSHLPEEQVEDLLQSIRKLIEESTLSREALMERLPPLTANGQKRQRWEVLCEQLALGLRRIALYRQVQESAIHDGLTGLFVRRYFQERLKVEVARGLRRRTSLAFLMVDLDHFKRVNDTYGHLVGDVVLRGVAGFLKRSVREIDLVGRYGGEEFGVALPETGREVALQVGERIRQLVEGSPIAAYDEKISMTVSIGIALCPKDAMTPSELVEQADQAMYQAKSMGRNRVAAL